MASLTIQTVKATRWKGKNLEYHLVFADQKCSWWTEEDIFALSLDNTEVLAPFKEEAMKSAPVAAKGGQGKGKGKGKGKGAKNLGKQAKLEAQQRQQEEERKLQERLALAAQKQESSEEESEEVVEEVKAPEPEPPKPVPVSFAPKSPGRRKPKKKTDGNWDDDEDEDKEEEPVEVVPDGWQRPSKPLRPEIEKRERERKKAPLAVNDDAWEEQQAMKIFYSRKFTGNGDDVFLDDILEHVLQEIARKSGIATISKFSQVSKRWNKIAFRPAVLSGASRRDMMLTFSLRLAEFVKQGDSDVDVKEVYKAFKKGTGNNEETNYWLDIARGVSKVRGDHFRKLWQAYVNKIESLRPKAKAAKLGENETWSAAVGLTQLTLVAMAVQFVGPICQNTWFCDYSDWTNGITYERGFPKTIKDTEKIVTEMVKELKAKIEFFSRIVKVVLFPDWQNPREDFEKIVKVTAKFSNCDSSWYSDAAQVLLWYVQYAFSSKDFLRKQDSWDTPVRELCSVHFSSWSSPDQNAIDLVADALTIESMRTKLGDYTRGLKGGAFVVGGYFPEKFTPSSNKSTEILTPHFFTTTDIRWHNPPTHVKAVLDKLEAVRAQQTDKAAAVEKHLKFIDEHYLPSHQNQAELRANYVKALDYVLDKAEKEKAAPSSQVTFEEMAAVQTLLEPNMATRDPYHVWVFEGTLKPPKGQDLDWNMSFSCSTDRPQTFKDLADLGVPERLYTGGFSGKNQLVITMVSQGVSTKYELTLKEEDRTVEGSAEKPGKDGKLTRALIKGRFTSHYVEFGNEAGKWRTSDAFAQGGKHRYFYHEQLPAIFSSKLAIDGEQKIHPVLRATQLFFDVNYFHPFCDGNGRASHLWLHYCLHREGLPFPTNFHLLCQLPKDPKKENYWNFAKALCRDLTN